MNQNNTPVFVTIIVVVLVFAGALFFAFDRIATLSGNVKSIEGRITALAVPPTGGQALPTSTPPTPPPPPASEPTSTSITIPAAIIFQTSSSEALPPQSRLTVTVESAKREVDGRVTLGLKVFSGEATGYAALDPRTLFELLNLEGDNVKANDMTGSFSTIPAKGAVSGTLTFQTDPARRTIILQVNLPEAKFYEFDFDRKTYKQAEVG
ncbi:MAG: hypothetical protein Q7S84_00655 [bacterium]|nr:hypothetical protein [bacterium]